MLSDKYNRRRGQRRKACAWEIRLFLLLKKTPLLLCGAEQVDGERGRAQWER